MDWKNIEPKVDELKNNIVKIIDGLLIEGQQENIITPDLLLGKSKEILLQTEFNIVICGEVKRGKSTFINAIVGQEILPTGVHETTSQVFKVSDAKDEAYHLVFKDGTKEEITREQLTRFGSQTDADLFGEPIMDGRRLDFIHIQIPVTFMPKGVNIVDTPGLGALYKVHSEITEGFITKAHAVLFILNPHQPLLQTEKEFLKKVFEITPYVMFVMTKIDEVSEEVWKNMIERDENLLQNSFGDKSQKKIKVYPVSSSLLNQAVVENDQIMRKFILEDSFYEKVREELMLMIFHSLGLNKSKFAYTEAAKYLKNVFPVIEEQLKMISLEDTNQKNEVKNKKNQLKKKYEESFGETGVSRQSIIKSIQDVLKATRSECAQLFNRHFETFQAFMNKIDNLNSLEDAKKYGDKIGTEIISELSSSWQKIMNNAQNNISVHFKEYKDLLVDRDADSLFQTSNTSISIPDNFINGGFKGILQTALPTMGVYTAGSLVLGLIGITLPVSLPIAICLGGIWGYFKGKDKMQEQELLKAKNELKKITDKIFNDVYNSLMKVDLANGKHKSILDEFIDELWRAVEVGLHSEYEKNLKQFNNEIQQLDKQSELNSAERKQELEKLNSQRKRLKSIDDELRLIYSQILELENLVKA